jgi:hypothetical protein
MIMKLGVTEMNDIDFMLDRLSAEKLPLRLMEIDDAVLSELSERKANAAPLSNGMICFAVVTALGMGIVGAVLPIAPAQASRSVTPFGAPVALAPSTLLDSGE